MTQEQILKEFYLKNPKRPIKHPEVVDWVTKEFLKRTGNIFRDPDRGIRLLAQTGFLVKVSKGIYMYDPDLVVDRTLYDFTPTQKKQIFERDGFKCVMCGRGAKEGVEIYADHIKPKEFGGMNTLENGQTLCGQHNNLKKTFKQTETGKKMFIRLYELAKKEKNTDLLKFTTQILEVFENNNINGHIIWKK